MRELYPDNFWNELILHELVVWTRWEIWYLIEDIRLYIVNIQGLRENEISLKHWSPREQKRKIWKIIKTITIIIFDILQENNINYDYIREIWSKTWYSHETVRNWVRNKVLAEELRKSDLYKILKSRIRIEE